LQTQAQKKIDKAFNIVYILKSLRKLEILSKLVLSKKQEFLIPILKENILSLENTNEESYLSPSDDIMSDSDLDGGFD
jgi:hypothetical protein